MTQLPSQCLSGEIVALQTEDIESCLAKMQRRTLSPVPVVCGRTKKQIRALYLTLAERQKSIEDRPDDKELLLILCRTNLNAKLVSEPAK